MTDQDNLRDRIAECQRQVLKRRALISDVDLPDYLAQAIIDDLGLTVETEPGHDPIECGCSSRAYPAESRVVEEREQR